MSTTIRHRLAASRLIALASAAVLLTAGAATAPTAASAAPGPRASARYTVTDLGTLGTGDFSSAADVNDLGQVVGSFQLNALHTHGFRWVNGVMTDLGTLPGGADSQATAINDAGQISGTANRNDGGFGYPVRWSATGAVTDLGGPVPNALGEGNGIDPAGRVVGGQRPDSSAGGALGTLYETDGARVNLGAVGPAQDANSRGQVVGGFPAYIWRNGATTFLPGLPEAPDSGHAFVSAVNVSGMAVGYAFNGAPDGATSAVFWHDGRIFDLGRGIPTNRANDVNAAGDVVGASSDPDCAACPTSAWVESAGTTATLDFTVPAGSGWTFESATGINDRGQIVGVGRHNGHARAFLLTPAFSATVNFQPAGAATPPGYTADTGAAFGVRGGGLAFGWNVNNSGNARDRDAARSPDQRYDTFNHMQKPGGATRWEIAAPNGVYRVHVVAGGPAATDSRFAIRVEDRAIASGTPSAAQRWIEGTDVVEVKDGRITLTNGPDALNNKVSYVEVASV